MRRVLLAICSGLFIMSFVGCDILKPKQSTQTSISPRKVKGTVIAVVGNAPLTLQDLNREIEAFNAEVPENNPDLKITTREQKINFLKNELVQRLLLYEEALRRGLDKDEEIANVLEKTKIRLLALELIRREAQNVDVSAKEIEDYYEKYKDQLKEPEERMIREIVVPTEQEAKDIAIRSLQGQDFASLAAEKSIAASAKKNGDLGFIKKGTRFVQFDNVAFSETLEVGKISNIFKGPDGYYVVKLEAKRGGAQRSLYDMRDEIKRGLTFLKQQQQIDDLLSKLSREIKIEIREGEIQ